MVDQQTESLARRNSIDRPTKKKSGLLDVYSVEETEIPQLFKENSVYIQFFSNIFALSVAHSSNHYPSGEQNVANQRFYHFSKLQQNFFQEVRINSSLGFVPLPKLSRPSRLLYKSLIDLADKTDQEAWLVLSVY